MADKNDGSTATISYVGSGSANASESSYYDFFSQYLLRPQAAPWLADVQRRLANSTSYGIQTSESSGQWLPGNIVSSARRFFETTSDLFPSEPYLYASRIGDLIAEFKGSRGPLTLIISDDSAVVHAVVDGIPVQRQFHIAAVPTNSVREQLAQVTKQLSAGQHGAVEAGP